ncbi:MAG: hypothetical protein NT147_06785, partial [Candidatus Aminicenantes bacterium]|nr:hypothetical protein [Candidatus Aminicenantes bacterium]
MAHETCPMEKTCGLRWLWKEVRDSVAGILERTTFADLVEKSRPRTARDQTPLDEAEVVRRPLSQGKRGAR